MLINGTGMPLENEPFFSLNIIPCILLGTPCTYDAATNYLQCDYVHINGLQTAVIPNKNTHLPPLTQIYQFEEYQSQQQTCDITQMPLERDQNDTEDIIGKCCTKKNFNFCMRTAVENDKKSIWKVVFLVKSAASAHLLRGLVDIPEANIQSQITVVTEEKANVNIGGIHVISFGSAQLATILAQADICTIFADMITSMEFEPVLKQLPKHCWLLLLEDKVDSFNSYNIEVMLEKQGYSLVVLKKCQYLQMTLYNKPVFCQDPVVVFANDHTHYKWVEEIKVKLSDLSATLNGRLWVICDKDCDSGIIGLINCLLQEIGGNQIRLVNVLFITLLFYAGF